MSDSERSPWFDQLASSYLAGESSLFVVHGPDAAAIEQTLVREFSRTRPIVGVVRSDHGLEFANMSDRSRFEQVLAGRAVFGGLRPLHSTRPYEALGQIWAALEVADPPQAWLVADAEALFPQKKHPEPLGGGAPPLDQWASAARLRESNHLVVAIGDPARLHADLTGAARVIDATPVLRLVHDSAPDLEVPVATVSDVEAPSDLADRLTAAFATSLAGWPAAAFPSRAPIMAAVARALADLPVPPCGPVEVRWDAEAGAVAEGPGAEWFLAKWTSDVAIDAAAGMISRGLQPPEGGYDAGGVPAVDPVGTRVLAKRLDRWFQG
jgi:hypothetical protein